MDQDPPLDNEEAAGQPPNGAAQAPLLAEIAALKNLKIPPFWKINPALWFVQIEAQFHNNRISSDNSKFNAIIAALDPEILNEVSDLVQTPPAVDKYLAFKKQLIARFTESKERQLNKLMTTLELGDKRPSSLLREMRRLAGENVPDDMLSTIWMSRMPNHVRGILSANLNIDLATLSEIADKIMDNMSTTSNQVFAANVDECRNNLTLDQRLTEVEATLANLTTMVQSLKADRNRSRGKSRTRSFSRGRKASSKEVCFYHSKYGEEARRCDKPCSFPQKN